MQKLQKPTFGIQQSPPVEEKPPQQEIREEIGAIWQRVSSKSKDTFFSIKMTIPKNKLKQLLETTEDKINLDLVAFPNRFKEGVESRPSYRIYEEKKR